MASNRWTTAQNEFLMNNAHRISWAEIAKATGRTEMACKKHYEKIVNLRRGVGTWKGF